MRKRFFTALALLFAGLATAGCAQLHKQLQHLVHPVYFETVQPVPSGVTAGIPPADLAYEIKNTSRRAVILPFAEYSTHTSPATHVEYHGMLLDSLEKALHAKGMESVVGGEGVNSFLLDYGVILDAAVLLREKSPRTYALIREIEEGEWSPQMAKQLGIKAHSNITATDALEGKVDSITLDRKVVQDIGAAFEADYVIRGRITVYQSGLKWGEFPHPDTTLAFYFPGRETSRHLVCVSSLMAYEWFDDGPVIPSPEEISSEKNPTFSKDAQKFAPLVRLDLFIQETAVGEVVYAESAETRVSQIHTMSRPRYSDELYKYLERVIPLTVERLFKGLD